MSPREASELPSAQRRVARQAFERFRRSREVALAEFREAVEPLLDEGAAQAAIARAIGVSRQRLWDLLHGE